MTVTNAERHKILAGIVVLEIESTERFIHLLEELFEEHQPSTPTQIILVENMAVARWRQLRTWILQKAALDHDVALQDGHSTPERAVAALRAPPQNTGSDRLLHRYEVASASQFSRALSLLQKIKKIAKRTQQVVDPT